MLTEIEFHLNETFHWESLYSGTFLYLLLFPTPVGNATIYFPPWLLLFAGIVFKPFSDRVKNLQFALTVTSLHKTR